MPEVVTRLLQRRTKKVKTLETKGINSVRQMSHTYKKEHKSRDHKGTQPHRPEWPLVTMTGHWKVVLVPVENTASNENSHDMFPSLRLKSVTLIKVIANNTTIVLPSTHKASQSYNTDYKQRCSRSPVHSQRFKIVEMLITNNATAAVTLPIPNVRESTDYQQHCGRSGASSKHRS